MKKFNLKNMDTRKFFGTIIGGIFFICCILFFTYAYYVWESEETSVAIGIEDLSTKCIPGADVNATNIGPVLDYQDGVKAEFSIKNEMNEVMAIDLRLDITSISDNLLTKSFKYAVLTDTTGGTNYDYDNPIIEGSFTNFSVGSNVIMTDLAVSASITQSFLFIVYIDGNIYNNPNMQENNLEANLMIGNCEENSLSMDSLVYQAIYSETDNSLTFVHTIPLTVGDTYNNKAVTAVYTGFETATYSEDSPPPWFADGNYANITSVDFEAVVSPVSTAYWFPSFSNLTSIDLERLDTSKVTNMEGMFLMCSSLTSLDLSSFNTSKVTNMAVMFVECSSLTELDLSNWDTSSVTDMSNMFYYCQSLTELDLSNWDTSSVTDMSYMFEYCQSLTELDLSGLDTSKVTNMEGMFSGCSSLTSLDLSSFNTSKVTNMASMFSRCGLTNLDLSSFDTSNVISMASMFLACSSLTSLDLSSFNTSSVTNMFGMFGGCSSLTSLDLSNFNTSKVTEMTDMFQACILLVNLDLSSFDTGSVTNMRFMFRDCSNLTSLDLSGFDMSNVTSMYQMFRNCNKLTTTILINNISINSGEFGYGYMFENAATAAGATITVNYTSANSSVVDNIVATKSTNSNVVKGTLVA